MGIDGPRMMIRTNRELLFLHYTLGHHIQYEVQTDMGECVTVCLHYTLGPNIQGEVQTDMGECVTVCLHYTLGPNIQGEVQTDMGECVTVCLHYTLNITYKMRYRPTWGSVSPCVFTTH